jgi:PAS domain S-box-containing protein
MRFHDAPIQRKLMTVLLLTSGAVLFVTCAAFVTYEVISLRRNLVRGYTVRAEILAANSTAALAFANETDAEDVLSALKGDPRTVAACLYDDGGNVFARYPATMAREAFPAAPLRSGHRFAPGNLEVFSPVIQGDRTLGTVYLRADLSILAERIVAFVWLTSLILLGSLLLAYFISKFLQRQISAPILALASAARAVSNQRDYSVRARKQGNDELGLLTDAFNQMLTEIDGQNQALSESEARLRAVLNSTLNAVVVMDSAGRIVDWNVRAEAMFGWPRNEALGRSLAETIIPPEYREAHGRGMEHYLKTGEGPVLNQLIELTALHRHGREFPVELSISPLKRSGTVTFCGFITDITERKRAARQNEVFAELGHSLSAVASADAAARAIVQAADALLGWDSCSVDLYNGEQHLVFPVLNVDTIEGQRTDVPPAYTGAAPSSVARRVLEEGGQIILRQPPFEFTPGTVPFGNTGRPSASLLFVPIRRGETVIGILSIQSYTPDAYDPEALSLLQTLADQCSGALERVRAEERLRTLNEELEQRVKERTAQLEAVNQELEAFSYSVSHDLRAPLRHVSGFAEMLQQGAAEKLNEVGQKYLRLISEAARRMGTLIDDLLVFSRMGRASLRRTRVDMNELVAEVMREMAGDVAGRDIHWAVVPLPELSVDRAMFKQVWINLISNAVKYTRQRARAEIHIECRMNGTGLWEFSVRDNGAGFDMRYADKLFGVFQRLHHAEEFEGTGIGLANVRRIIIRHGGQTWAEGRVDEGATFYFSLPPNEEGKNETKTYSAGRGQLE